MIIAAAIRDEVQGYNLSLLPPARHHDIINALANRGYALPIKGDQGFIDDQRGFVDRLQAADIAVSQGQIPRLRWPPQLFSEDLW